MLSIRGEGATDVGVNSSRMQFSFESTVVRRTGLRVRRKTAPAAPSSLAAAAHSMKLHPGSLLIYKLNPNSSPNPNLNASGAAGEDGAVFLQTGPRIDRQTQTITRTQLMAVHMPPWRQPPATALVMTELTVFTSCIMSNCQLSYRTTNNLQICGH